MNSFGQISQPRVSTSAAGETRSVGGGAATAASAAKRSAVPSRSAQYWVAILVASVCLAIGGLGGLFTASTVDTWYTTLLKPPWNPPNAVFGPVWTTLYAMMAVSYWLVWRASGSEDQSQKAGTPSESVASKL